MFDCCWGYSTYHNITFLQLRSVTIHLPPSHRSLFRTYRTHARRGYGLYRVLLSLLITIMVVRVIGVMFMTFSKLPSKPMALDVAYAISSVTTLVNTSSTVEVNETNLVLNRNQTVSLHKSRLVVQPGFNILLHHIDEVYFKTIGDKVYMTLYRDEKEGTYYVGTSYRPKERISPDPIPDESIPDPSTDSSANTTY